jgi:hypothetical protein
LRKTGELTGPATPGTESGFRPQPTHLVLAMIVGTFLVRSVLATTMGLSFDESYIFIMSRQPALGYFDHPPLTIWLVGAIRWLTGSDIPLVVRLPSLLLFAGTTWIIYRLGSRLFDPWAGVIGAAALNLAPIFGIYIASIAVTDGPMLFGVALGANCLCSAVAAQDPVRWWAWFATGVGFGLALLSKFIPVLLAPGIVIFLLAQPRYRRWLWHPAPYIALAIVGAFLLPVVVWNVANDWQALRFHGPRAAVGAGLQPLRALAHLGIVAIVVLPGIWFGLVWSVAKTLMHDFARPERWLLALMAAGPMLVFPLLTLLGAAGRPTPHWQAAGYLLAFPLLGGLVVGITGRLWWWVRWSSITSAVVTLLVVAGLVAHIMTGWVRTFVPQFATYDPIVSDQVDWWDLRLFLEERQMLDPQRIFLIGDRLEDCSKIGVVVGDLLPVVCHTRNPIRHALADSSELIGQDGLYITRIPAASNPQRMIEGNFASIELLGTLTMTKFGLPLVRTQLILGRDLQRAFTPP